MSPPNPRQRLEELAREYPKAASVLIVVLCLLLGGTTASLVIDSDGPDGPTPPKTVVTVKIPKAGGAATGNAERVAGQPGTEKAKSTVATEVPKRVLDTVKNGEVGQHADSRDETPAGVTAAAAANSQRKQDQIRQTQQPLPTAGASAGFQGCVTRFVGNQSTRRGVRPQLQVLHYTVSSNVAGWADVNAIVALFNRASSQASSHFVIDSEGHCAYIVPIEAKSWTQAGGNPYAVSYEIIATGRESTYLAPAGLEKLRSVARQVAGRTGIPLRAGAVFGCVPGKSGIVQHKDGGLCWGGHVDITPFSSSAVIKSITTGNVAASATAKSTKPERRIVARRCYHHRKRFTAGASRATRVKQLAFSRRWKAAAGRQKGRLDAAHRRGQSWRQDSIGTRRKVMARAERFARADRRALCR